MSTKKLELPWEGPYLIKEVIPDMGTKEEVKPNFRTPPR
jgi:hypothetical protein